MYWQARSAALTVRPVAGRFMNEIAWNSVVTPAEISRRSKVANANGAGTVGTRAYGHAVAEEFNGSSSVVRYQQFASDLNILAATPVIEGDAADYAADAAHAARIHVDHRARRVRVRCAAVKPPTAN